LVLVGEVVSENEKAVQVALTTTKGDVKSFIPKAAIVRQNEMEDGQTAMLLTDCEEPAWRVEQFIDHKGAPVIDPDLSGMVDELEYADEDTVEAPMVNLTPVEEAPMVNLTSVDEDLEMVDIEEEPIEEEIPIEEEEHITTETTEQEATGTNIDADEDYDDSIPAGLSTAPKTNIIMPGQDVEHFAATLQNGGREKHVVPWRSQPLMKPCYVMDTYDENSGEAKFTAINDAAGKGNMYAVLNPDLASDDRPAGALLAKVSAGYTLVPHTRVFDPIIEGAEASGVYAQVTSFNQGAVARLDLDVTGATQNRKDASARFSQFQQDNGRVVGGMDISGLGDLSQKMAGLYRLGFTVMNGVDGKTALSVEGGCLRTYCTNLANMGAMQSFARFRHTKSLALVDWDGFAANLVNAVTELEMEIMVREAIFPWIPLEAQMFDRLLTVASKHSIVALPVVQNIDNKQIVQRGQTWRVANEGWENPDVAWVKVDQDAAGSAYHAWNVFSGMLTHKPEWADKQKKGTTMKGTILNFETFNKRSKGSERIMKTIANSTLSAYRQAADKDSISEDDLPDFANFVNEHPEVIFVPTTSNPASGSTPLSEFQPSKEVIQLHV
tara:strand:+ start:1084 stop:2910 length:1827 start_codon:yes stop_codon:yes gene_type:complete